MEKGESENKWDSKGGGVIGREKTYYREGRPFLPLEAVDPVTAETRLG